MDNTNGCRFSQPVVEFANPDCAGDPGFQGHWNLFHEYQQVMTKGTNWHEPCMNEANGA